MIITIDGPAASGKSTVSYLLAQQLGFFYVSSGFIFRGLAYLLLHKWGYTLETIGDASREAMDTCLDPKRFMYRFDHNGIQIAFDATDITPHLKDAAIDRGASIIAAQSYARDKYLDVVRSIATAHNIVAEGRDMGTIVFPEAQIKIFLTATVDERARRWRALQKIRGDEISELDALQAIIERDERDENRTVAPLVIPEGAYIIDNTGLTIGQTLETVMALIDGGKEH